MFERQVNEISRLLDQARQVNTYRCALTNGGEPDRYKIKKCDERLRDLRGMISILVDVFMLTKAKVQEGRLPDIYFGGE